MEELWKDLYVAECKQSKKYRTVIFILSIVTCILAMLCGFLLYELSTYEEVVITETTTTETYENDVDGDNANIVNGNQYNDSAIHNEGDIDGEE